MSAFKPGHSKKGGRKKGTPNAATRAVKAALQEAFDGLGGVPALIRWAKKEPGEFYRLWAKLLPVEVRNPDGEAFRLEVVEEIVTAHEDDPQDGSTPPGPVPVPPL